mgnify:CR=1 FL=1
MDNSVCFEKFKDYLTNVKKASSNTLSSYLRDIRQFGEYLDSHETVGYTEADEEVLNGYISWLRGMGKSVATVSRSIASLKCFYTFLILQRIVSENPTGKLVPGKCEQKLFTKREVSSFRASICGRTNSIYSLNARIAAG